MSALVGEGRGREKEEKGRKEANRAHPWPPSDIRRLGVKYPTQAFGEIIQSMVSEHGVSLLLGFLYVGGGGLDYQKDLFFVYFKFPCPSEPMYGLVLIW